MKRALAILAGGLLCLWLGSPPALAHALLASSDPAAGATVATSPPRVSLMFTEPPDPKLPHTTTNSPPGPTDTDG